MPASPTVTELVSPENPKPTLTTAPLPTQLDKLNNAELAVHVTPLTVIGNDTVSLALLGIVKGVERVIVNSVSA